MAFCLKSYGIRGVALRWLKLFSSNRLQVVKYYDTLSEIQPIKTEVSLVSIHDPILFLTLISEINMTHTAIFMYKCTHNLPPHSFENKCILLSDIHQHETRPIQIYRMQIIKTDRFKDSIYIGDQSYEMLCEIN